MDDRTCVKCESIFKRNPNRGGFYKFTLRVKLHRTAVTVFQAMRDLYNYQVCSGIK